MESPIEPRPLDELRATVKNWAEVPAFRDRVRAEVLPLLLETRSARASREEEWRENFRVWAMQKSAERYAGDADLYVPAGARIVETQVSQLVDQMFGSDEQFGVKPADPVYGEFAQDVRKRVMERMDACKIRTVAEELARNLIITGNAPARVSWKLDTARHIVPRREKGLVPEETIIFDGPMLDPVDPLNFYVFPETVKDLNDALVVFEVITTTKASLMARAREGRYVKTEVDLVGAQRVNSNYESEKGVAEAKNSTLYKFVDVFEVYLRMDPEAATADAEVDPLPMVITLTSDGRVLRGIENPFWLKRPPYVMGRGPRVTGQFYGTGGVKFIKDLQRLLNDQVNQGLDCGTYALNPILLYQEDLLVDELADLEPGKAYSVRDIGRAMRWDRPPPDLIQASGIQSSQTMSWMQDMGGSPPVLSGGSAPGRAFRSATGIGTAQRNAIVPLAQVVRKLEEDVWEPTAHWFWMLEQQFSSLPLPKGETAPRAVPGEWRFKWLASTQMQAAAMRGQSMVQFLTMVSNPAMQELIRRNGGSVNPIPVLRSWARDTLQLSDVEATLQEGKGNETALAQPVPGGLVPGMPPPPTGEEEALPPGAEDPTGQGGATRMEANLIAALAGAAGGAT